MLGFAEFRKAGLNSSNFLIICIKTLVPSLEVMESGEGHSQPNTERLTSSNDSMKRRDSVESHYSQKSYVSIKSWQNKSGYLEERTEINQDQKEILLQMKRYRTILVVISFFSIFLALLVMPFPALWFYQGYYVSGVLDYINILILIGCCIAVIYVRQSLSPNKMRWIATTLCLNFVASLAKMTVFHLVFDYFSHLHFGLVIGVDIGLFLLPVGTLLFYVRQLIKHEDTLRAFGYILNSMTSED